MNGYKKIIKSRDARILILKLMGGIPDKTMVRLQYRIKTGRKLNLKKPQRYTEKLQWYKLYYRDALMSEVVDKYTVRKYIKKIGLEYILNECYGVYTDPNEIDFSKLPNKFVIKDTLGSGGDSVIICEDKNQLNIAETKKKMKHWLQTSKGKNVGREWVYDGKRNRIIIEELIESDKDKGGLVDYKFFCFNGTAKYVYGIAERELGVGAGLGIYNRDFEKQPYRRVDERALKHTLQKPDNYYEMMRIAEYISKPFPHARVDMYSVKDKILFGEITFFDGSGYMIYEPDEFDYLLGKEFLLPEMRG